MVQVAKPWRHPETNVYYLRRQIPEPIRCEFGGRVLWKETLATRDPAEAARLFAAANAELERRFAAARAVVGERRARDVISTERAEAIVAKALGRRPGDRYAALTLVYWAEEAAVATLGAPAPGLLPSFDDDGVIKQDGITDRLPGDTWLGLVQGGRAADLERIADGALEPILAPADPPVVRTPENVSVVLAAFTAAVRTQNERLRAEIAFPSAQGKRPRLRPQLRLRELFEEWRRRRNPRPQTIDEARNAMEDLIDYIGDVPVSLIDSDMLYNYRDAAALLPSSMPRRDHKLRFTERVAKHRDSSSPRVRPTTLKKRISCIQALLTFAEGERWVQGNVGRNIKVDGYTKGKSDRRSFRDGELKTLFESRLFLERGSWSKCRSTISDRTLFWLFVLGLTSGARIEEVGQARLQDVREDGGIHFIEIDDGDGRNVKTDESRRLLPLHDIVLRLRFIDYCGEMREAGEVNLFPDLLSNRYGKRTKEASRRANRYIGSIVSDDPRLVFHSLRHTFKDLGKDVLLPDYILDQICGHAPLSVGGRYGMGARLRTIKEALDRIRFEAVDWDRLTSVLPFAPKAQRLIEPGASSLV